jgi:hypothetical protein
VTENRFGQPTVNIKNDPQDVEDRIKAMVVMKRVRIAEFYKDFDKLRKGKVTCAQFRSVLSMLNFNLTVEEFECIEQKYITADKFVNYKDFCENIDIVFTTKGLEKNPGQKVNNLTQNDTFVARKKFLEIDEEDQE